MMISLAFVYTLLYGFVALTLIVFALLLLQKRNHKRKTQQISDLRDYIFTRYFDQQPYEKKINRRLLLEEFINIQEQMIIPDDIHTQLIKDLDLYGYFDDLNKQLTGRNRLKRKKAAHQLAYIKRPFSIEMLVNQLKREKDESVKVYLVNALRSNIDNVVLSAILDSMIKANRRYLDRVYALLSREFEVIVSLLPVMIEDTRYEVMRFVLKCAIIQPNKLLEDYVLKIIQEVKKNLRKEANALKHLTKEQCATLNRLAVKALSVHYPEHLNNSFYLYHDDPYIIELSIEAKANQPSIKTLNELIQDISGSKRDNIRISALSEMVRKKPLLMSHLLVIFPKLTEKHKIEALAKVLATRVDYLILKLYQTQDEAIYKALDQIIGLGYHAEIIDFFNQNNDKNFEKELLALFSKWVLDYPLFREECQLYLQERHCLSLGLVKKRPEKKEKAREPKEPGKVRWLIALLIFSVIFIPLSYLFEMRNVWLDVPRTDFFRGFVLRYNLYLVYYYLFVNAIYLLLIAFSFYYASEQLTLWRIKKNSMLFQPGFLPSISIIAPAYNESLSIIESITSLLNLKYPKYEVVVVNDGSSDDTLLKLINHFALERQNPLFETPIKTQPIRGVYKTKMIPNLTVVDKQNGGKADALNVGINLAKHAFVCGIDADSVLEGDALLKIASVAVDHNKPMIAIGGNIYPANGCVIDKGKIEKKGLSDNTLVAFQSLEYLRAFTSGRLGWAKMKSLLIISGAFGLFDKRTLIEAGGYLTSSGEFKKNTVGEDMELVVRLTFNALKKQYPYRVDYVYNAACYTELPSDMKSLLKQRDRWHRGLIDILHYHRRLMFNPRYKQPGTLGFPYFLIFEVIGPLFEVQGYFMLFIALILGLLNPAMMLAIFLATVGFGIIVSLSSLLVAEREGIYLNKKDSVKLVFYAIIENFGYRQLISLYRARSFFSALFDKNVWGEQKRKGFAKK